jgi:isopenicillin N synthase-like dioxygenase
MLTNSPSQAPTSRTRYSIPYFLGVRLDLTLKELQESAAHIVQRIPASDDRKKRAVDVPSEFLSPLYSCVSYDTFLQPIKFYLGRLTMV